MNIRAIGCLIFLLVGCGASYQAESSAEGNAEYFGESYSEFQSTPADGDAIGLPSFGQPPGPSRGAKDTTLAAVDSDAVLAAAEAAPAAAENADDGAKSAERKIVYEATVSLVVDDFGVASEAIQKLVAQVNGYMGQVSIDRTQGEFRTGRWVARIPVDKFSEFLENMGTIGVAERQGQTTQDVTMEYLDLQARIKTKKELEKRILDLLADRNGKLQDVIAAEQELARVRSEIESMEGRLRYLQNRTSFSTVTIDVREEKDYVPPKAPTVGDRIATVWHRSWDSLRNAGVELLVAGVAFVPWILPTALTVLVGFVILRVFYRKVRRRFFESSKT